MKIQVGHVIDHNADNNRQPWHHSSCIRTEEHMALAVDCTLRQLQIVIIECDKTDNLP